VGRQPPQHVSQPRDELAPDLPGRTLVTLTSVSDDDLGDELTVVWEVEPGREVLPETRVPAVTPTGWDEPQVLAAFLDAVRWVTAGFKALRRSHGLEANPFSVFPERSSAAMAAYPRRVVQQADDAASWSGRTAPVVCVI
jgi:hypothetical protein